MEIHDLREDPLTREERERSDFVRELVQRHSKNSNMSPKPVDPPPRHIVQFWDDLDNLPEDVMICMESWRVLENAEFKIEIFDEDSARNFIEVHLGRRFTEAFDKCYHPSMKSDYFRYSYIFIEGGFYIDADDVYHNISIDHLFIDGRLKLQPFCYDIATAQMVSPSVFLTPGANQPSWIFYFNTTPLIAARNHPIVGRALMNATQFLERATDTGLPEVQASTGPGNLTRSVFEILNSPDLSANTFCVVHEWENISTSKWPLGYRNDKRNWRLSNQETYERLKSRKTS